MKFSKKSLTGSNGGKVSVTKKKATPYSPTKKTVVVKKKK